MTKSDSGDVVARPHWLARRLPRVGLVLVSLLLVMQLIPIRIENHPVTVEPNWDSPRTRELVVSACADCHTNQARSAWYEKIAPVSWWIKGHVDEGRDELNFSKCGTKGAGSDESVETIREGSMPPSYYTWLGLHGGARLSASERDELAAGLRATATLGCRKVP